MSDPGVYDAFILADKKLKAESDMTTSAIKKDSVQYDTVYTPVMDSLGNKVDSTMKLVEKKMYRVILGHYCPNFRSV